MHLIVAGSRTMTDESYVRNRLETLPFPVTALVSGTCRGPDSFGERWAKDHNIAVERFPADWSLGKHAGPMRNRAMAQHAHALLAFWDGESRGTKNMIDEALRHGLWVQVVYYTGKAKQPERMP